MKQRWYKNFRSPKTQILKVQNENRNTNNLRRVAYKFKLNDVVVNTTRSGSQIKSKYLGSYKIIKVKQNDAYNV